MIVEYLPRRLYLKVRDLLNENISVNEIAQRVPLSLATIEGIAADQLGPSRLVVEEDDPLREEMLTARRCPECGAMVYVWPCLGCQMTHGRTATPRKRVVGLQLKYKQRRAERRKAA